MSLCRIKFKIAILIIFIGIDNLYAQIINTGVPKIINYTKQDYNAGTQNWSIVQDQRGIMYFANNDGVLEFDGTNWNLIRMPNHSIVRSLKVDKKGVIYVGAFSEFGMLKPDKKGNYIYVSLVDKLPEENKNFDDIWKIHETREGICFQSFNELFLYDGKEIKIIAQKREFQFSYYVNGKLYITELNKGLLYLENGKLFPVEGGEIFNNNIWAMMDMNSSEVLIGTTNNGLFKIKDNKVARWNVSTNKLLEKYQIYCASKLGNAYYAFGTIQNGLIIIDKNGDVVQWINRDKGLNNNTVLSLYVDNSENIWLGLDNGINYVIVNSPFTYLEQDGEIGAGYASVIFKNKLYLGTNQGLFYQPWPVSSVNNDELHRVLNTQGQVWSLSIFKNNLICGHNEGTFHIVNNMAQSISYIRGAWKYISIPFIDNYIIGGTYTGLNRLVFDTGNQSWNFDKVINGIVESCRVIEFSEAENKPIIWMSHVYKGVYKIELSNDLSEVINIDFYNSESGLKTDIDNYVLDFDGEIVVSNPNGFYQFQPAKKNFISYEKLNNLFQIQEGYVRKLIKDNLGNYWFFQGDEMGVAKLLNDGTYIIQKKYFRQLKGSFIAGYENVLPYDEHNVIIAYDEGFIHYDPTKIKDISAPFNAYIRSVSFVNDSLIYGGTIDRENEILIKASSDQIQTLPYRKKGIKFSFSSDYYENQDKVLYSYYLKGFEDKWSGWNKGVTKEYTNLREGIYEFNLKARNIYDTETDVVTYKFNIEPPFYRSVIAYILYFLILLAFVYYSLIYVRRRFERAKKVLQLRQQREMEQQKQEHENRVLSVEQEITKLRNEKLQLENEKNRADVDMKTKELANYAMQITQKNEALYRIKDQLKHISQKVNPDAQNHLQKLVKKIEKETNPGKDWDKFEGYFDQVYEDFTKRLREIYPQLTPNDIKLCAYLRMNLSTKEIAPLLNISMRGVEISRYRLRKKLKLARNDNLVDFMMNL